MPESPGSPSSETAPLPSRAELEAELAAARLAAKLAHQAVRAEAIRIRDRRNGCLDDLNDFLGKLNLPVWFAGDSRGSDYDGELVSTVYGEPVPEWFADVSNECLSDRGLHEAGASVRAATTRWTNRVRHLVMQLVNDEMVSLEDANAGLSTAGIAPLTEATVVTLTETVTFTVPGRKHVDRGAIEAAASAALPAHIQAITGDTPAITGIVAEVLSRVFAAGT